MKQSSINSPGGLTSRIADSRDRLYRVALAWCGDEMTADDLVQETMANGIVNCWQLRDENRLFAWLYSILNNNWHTHRRKNRVHAELDDQQPSNETGPMATYQELEIVHRVRLAVAMLPVDQRQIISLVDLDGCSYSEVAQILNIPIGTVMSRLHRSRKNLLSELKTSATEPATDRPRIRLVK